MKITDMRLENYRWPKQAAQSNGKHTYTHEGRNFVFIDTDEGITGVGQIGGTHTADSINKAIFDYYKEFVIGKDPFNNEQIWDELWEPKISGRRGMTTRVISGIDIALWDIKGKAANQPVYKLLGGYTNRVPVYIAGGYYEDGKGIKELQEEMIAAVNQGSNAVKMKVGAVPINEDIARVKAVREAIGPDIKLMVDANCAYRFYEAIEIAKKMEPYDIFWFEEPIAPDDYKGHQLISQATSVPIATGENEYTRYGFRDLIESRAAAILQPDALIMGGPTEFMKVSAQAQAHDLPIAPHGRQEVHIHLLCAIPNGLILEYYSAETDPIFDKVYEYKLEVDNGYVSPPELPGFGMEPNLEFLQQYRVS